MTTEKSFFERPIERENFYEDLSEGLLVPHFVESFQEKFHGEYKNGKVIFKDYASYAKEIRKAKIRTEQQKFCSLLVLIQISCFSKYDNFELSCLEDLIVELTNLSCEDILLLDDINSKIRYEKEYNARKKYNKINKQSPKWHRDIFEIRKKINNHMYSLKVLYLDVFENYVKLLEKKYTQDEFFNNSTKAVGYYIDEVKRVVNAVYGDEDNIEGF